jgi:hypothetical protein
MRPLKLLFALLPMIAGSATLASAAPFPKTGGAAPVGVGLPVEKVHGWHRHCEWGPARYHRHVPGVGNVACGHPGYGYYARPYVHTYVWRAPRHHHWRHHHRHDHRHHSWHHHHRRHWR